MMTDLERLRPTVNARQQLSEQEADAIIDAHLKEDAARDEALQVLNAQLDETEAELAELREAVRAWDKASRIWFDTAQGRPFDPEEAARKSIERRKTEDGLRQLIEEKP